MSAVMMAAGRRQLHTRRRRARRVLGLLTLALATVTLASLAIGPVAVPLDQLAAILARPLGWPAQDIAPHHLAVVEAIRLPRTLLGLLVGAALAMVGATLQGLFRNPLADPGLIGVSAGAALAAVAVIVLGSSGLGWLTGALGVFSLPLAAFVGGALATLLAYRLATGQGRTAVATLLLAGIAINALAGAGTGLFTYLADDTQLRTLTFWMMGSLGGATWTTLAGAAPFILLAVVVLPRLDRALNALLLGEAEAGHLGVDTQRVKGLAVALTALAVGAAVAVSGVIGFVGLVAPHLLRLLIGPDHRYLLPGSALLGASLLLLADLLARTLVAPAELPIGILTALVGGPFFLWLLARRRRSF